MLSRVLTSASFIARRRVTTTASRQVSESTGVSRDAKEFLRMIRNDRLILPLLLAFSSVFGFVHYHVSPYYYAQFCKLFVKEIGTILIDL